MHHARHTRGRGEVIELGTTHSVKISVSYGVLRLDSACMENWSRLLMTLFGTDGAGTGLSSAMICCHGGDRVRLANHGELTM